MILLPLRKDCAFLGLNFKTFRHWMHQANLSVHPHPRVLSTLCEQDTADLLLLLKENVIEPVEQKA
jgi:hypothetical protein